MRPILLLPLALSATLGCGLVDVGGPARTTMYVHHHLAECIGVDIQSCLLVQEPGAAGLGLLHQGIEGFTWEWGYIHSIAIEVHEVPNPPADGSSVRYVLDRIIDRERVAAATRFEIVVTTSAGRVSEVSEGEYRLLGSGRFRCGSTTNCESLDEVIAAGGRVQLTLAHDAEEGAPMRLVALQACASAGAPHPFRCQ